MMWYGSNYGRINMFQALDNTMVYAARGTDFIRQSSKRMRADGIVFYATMQTGQRQIF
jgi:hypothetical protein